MLDFLFTSVIGSALHAGSFFLCTAASLLLGAVIMLTYMFKNRYTPSFLMTLLLLPVVVQVVILLVNGNIGAGVAVAGTFSLVRFRSAQGTAREICAIFAAMAAGLACGMGYIGVAAVLVLVVALVSVIFTALHVGVPDAAQKQLKITMPEGVDYGQVFDDVLQKYTLHFEQVSVRTAELGSLYKITYEIVLKDPAKEKEMIDELRCRNGNLDIICARRETAKEAL